MRSSHRHVSSRHVSLRGFTLLEILVTIAIIIFLFTLIATVAVGARERARIVDTKSLIGRIHLALESYRTQNQNEYPSGGSSTSDTWPSPYATTGVQLDRSLVLRDGVIGDFNKQDFDAATGTLFVDAWGHPLRYRKVAPSKILIWSYGPNGKDEIGLGQIWDPKTNAYVGGAGGGRQERMGDDISQNDIDF